MVIAFGVISFVEELDVDSLFLLLKGDIWCDSIDMLLKIHTFSINEKILR